jgi:hypothetical protein
MKLLLDYQNQGEGLVALFLKLGVNLVGPLMKGGLLWASLLSSFLEKFMELIRCLRIFL